MIPRVALLLGVVVSGALAQGPVASRRAFEPAVSFSLENRHFGGRQVMHERETATYDAPLGFSGLLQWPLSARSGVAAEVTVHPSTRQAVRAGWETRTGIETLTHVAMRVALDWRFKPFVPVYFFGGGGVAHVTRIAATGVPGPITERELLFGVGVDLRPRERIGLKFRYIGFVVFPNDPGVPLVTARGPTYDYAWQAGVRLSLNRHPARSAR